MLNIITALENESNARYNVDDKMLESIAHGNMAAFHELYTNISVGIYSFALSITKNTYDAEDVLQETFLTIHQKAYTYEAHGKPMAWIFTIARNCALMKFRLRKKEAELDEAQVDTSAAFSRIDSVEERMTVQSALRILSDEERQIVMLHAVAGMKNREIAAVLELPLNTVLSKYHRAIGKMKDYIEREDF